MASTAAGTKSLMHPLSASVATAGAVALSGIRASTTSSRARTRRCPRSGPLGTVRGQRTSTALLGLPAGTDGDHERRHPAQRVRDPAETHGRAPSYTSLRPHFGFHFAPAASTIVMIVAALHRSRFHGTDEILSRMAHLLTEMFGVFGGRPHRAGVSETPRP